MFRLKFNFWKIFKEDTDNNKDYFYYHKQISENKNFEIQISKFHPTEIFDFTIDTNFKGDDHAGPEFEFTIYNFFFSVKIYDKRHWNNEKRDWYSEEDWEAEMQDSHAETTYQMDELTIK